MAFNNLDQAIHRLSDEATPQATLTTLHAINQAVVPWVFKPLDGAIAVDAHSAAYVLAGRDTHSVIVWSKVASPGVTADTAPVSFSLEVWGSHTNDPGSFVKVATITTAGETKISGEYAYVVFNVGAITAPTLSTPAAPTLTPSTTGGTLAIGTTYNYRIAARSANGTTLAGPEAATNAATTTATSSIAVTWAAVPGAVSYDVYGRTAGGELLLTNVAGTSYTDTGALTPAGALPASNTATIAYSGLRVICRSYRAS